MSVNARNRPLIPVNSFFRLRRHSGHELVLGKSNREWLTVKLLLNLSMIDRCIWIWYTDIKIKSPLNLSVPLHDFFPWLSTDTHIRFLAVHRILRWIIVRLLLHIQKPLSSSGDMNWLCWVKSSILTSVHYFRRCTLYLWCLPYWFVKYPDGWYLYLHHLYEPRNFYVSYSTNDMPDKISTWQLNKK